jgi:hypothetical protein
MWSVNVVWRCPPTTMNSGALLFADLKERRQSEQHGRSATSASAAPWVRQWASYVVIGRVTRLAMKTSPTA